MYFVPRTRRLTAEEAHRILLEELKNSEDSDSILSSDDGENDLIEEFTLNVEDMKWDKK